MKKWIKRIGYTILTVFILLNIVSAFHAYKFTHFYENGTGIKRPEQMSIVDKATAICFGINYPKSKVVDSLLIPHNTISITTNDSVKLEAWHLMQPALGDLSESKGTVLLFHGHGSSKSALMQEATEFYRLGYNVLMTDFRAHGNSEGTVCTIGYNESKDVKAAYDYIQQKGETHIVLWGISLGAASIAKAIADFNLQPQKVILEMPFGSLHNAVKGRVKMMGLPQQPISAMLTFWGGIEQGFWAFNHNPADYVKKIKSPVLLQWGVLDSRVTNEETTTLFNNIPVSNKKFVQYENSGHVSLCSNENEKWITEVQSFLGH